MGRLDGKVAFVTGAARGQGRAHAQRLAHEGADIIAADICAPVATVKYSASTPADLQETARLVEKEGRRIVARPVDTRDVVHLEELVKDGVAELGRLDVVVANAGILTAGRFWEITTEQWNDMIGVNLTGTFNTVKASVPIMIEQGSGGSVILISSVAGMVGQPFVGHYVTTKHGIVGMTKSLANELGEYNIRVNSVHPIGVNTTMISEPDLFPLIEERATTLGPIFMNTLPFDFLEPEDVAGLVAFLASDEAKYMTGAQVPIDLGNINR
jgi:SDR family mycofactocin-dependent oxidoreductase